MKSILNVQQADVTTYCYYGSLTSILKSQKNYQDWLNMSFISLRMNSGGKITFDITPSPVFYTPWTKYYKAPRDILAMQSCSIVEYIIRSIDLGYYLMVKVNRYFVKCNFRYLKSNNDHEIFVYGYNSETQEIYVCDNLDHGRFVYETCEFDEFEQAFHGVSKDKIDGIIQVKVCKPSKDVQFDKDLVLERLSRYISSGGNVFEYAPLPEGTVLNQFDDVVGFEVNLEYLKRINEIMELGCTKKLDLRNVYLLKEHKEQLYSRMIYLVDRGYLHLSARTEEKLVKLVEVYDYVLMLSTKYNLCRSAKSLKRICLLIEEAVSIEKDIVDQLVDKITYC